MTNENTQMIIAGSVYIDKLDGNLNSTGLIGPLNSDEIMLAQEVEEMDMQSYMRDTWGQTRASVNLPQPSSIKINMMDQPANVLAIALLGEALPEARGISSITDENVTAVLDTWVQLANKKINPTLPADAVQDNTDTTTYVEGTDYEMNYELGLIRCLSTGAITNSEVLHMDYDLEAITGESVVVGTNTQINCRLLIDGVNKVTNQAIHVEAFQVALRPDGDIALKSTEYITTGLTGKIVTPDGQTGPMKVTIFG